MSRTWMGYILIIVGVVLNNVVYLQDLWLGQDNITLDSWRAILGILVAIAMVVVGLLLIATAARGKAG